jgi:hypothetical protein
MFAESLDKSKAITANVDHSTTTTHSFQAGTPQLSDKQFGALIRGAREHLSTGSALFVHDGCVGLEAGAGATVRSFCDSATGASLLHHTLRTFALPLFEDETAEVDAWRATLPQELQEDPERAAELVRRDLIPSPPARDTHSVTQFLLSSWKPSDEALSAIVGSHFSVVDPVRRIVLHVGNNVNARAVRSGLLALHQGSLVLPGHTILADGARAVVVLGASPAQRTWAEHHTLWTDSDVLTPAWLAGELPLSGSATTLSPGDYVERSKSGSSVVARWRGSGDVFRANAPSAVGFVQSRAGSGKKSASTTTPAAPQRVNPEQARQLATEAGMRPADVETLAARLLKGKIPVMTTSDANINASWLQTVLKV